MKLKNGLTLKELMEKRGEYCYTMVCPCCGEYKFTDEFDICPVCGWQNDPVQYSNPNDVGANAMSLIQYVKWFDEMRKKNHKFRWDYYPYGIDEKDNIVTTKHEKELYTDNEKDEFQAYLIDGANQTNNEGYPILEKWMIPTLPPKQIIPFDKIKMYTAKEIEESYICFYCQDSTFKRVYKSPISYYKMFRRCAGLIGFDISVFEDMPIYMQKEILGKNLSLDYYYGSNNFPIIPNIRWGSDELADEYLAAIPKHVLIAVGTYGFIKTNEEKERWRKFLVYVSEKLEPAGIVVYGTTPSNVFDVIKDKNIPIYQYESFKSKRMKIVHKK